MSRGKQVWACLVAQPSAGWVKVWWYMAANVSMTLATDWNYRLLFDGRTGQLHGRTGLAAGISCQPTSCVRPWDDVTVPWG